MARIPRSFARDVTRCMIYAQTETISPENYLSLGFLSAFSEVCVSLALSVFSSPFFDPLLEQTICGGQ